MSNSDEEERDNPDEGMKTATSLRGRRSLPSVSQHIFQIHNYKRPTFCAHCGGLLVGVVKQGLRCKRCEVDVHEKCQEDLRKACIEVIVGHHNFREKSYKQLTYCDFCEKLLVGVVNQGLKCTECGANVHDKCQEKIEITCEAVKSRLKQSKTTTTSSIQRGRGTRKSMKKAKPTEKTPLSSMNTLEEANETGGVVNRDYSNLFDTMPEKKPTDVLSLPGSPEHDQKKETRSHSLTPSTSGSVQVVQKQVNEVTSIMAKNYNKALKRGDNLEHLQETSDELVEKSKMFQEKATDLKKRYWWKNKKMWIVISVAILLLVVIVVVVVVLNTK